MLSATRKVVAANSSLFFVSKVTPVFVRRVSGNVADTVSLLSGDVKQLRATIEKFAQEELAPFGINLLEQNFANPSQVLYPPPPPAAAARFRFSQVV